MRLLPGSADFKKWAKQIPTHGDVLFLKSPTLLKHYANLVLSPEETRAQTNTLWSLTQRSWYGYRLNASRGSMFLPKGTLDSLPREEILRLAKEQHNLGVPTLISATHLSADLKKKLLKVNAKLYWITSSRYTSLSSEQKISLLKAWWKQSKLHVSSSVELQNLSKFAQKHLRQRSLQKTHNHFAAKSGPNCFAFTAALLCKGPPQSMSQKWLHFAPFLKELKRASYKKLRSSVPQQGDALVFLREKQGVHAAFYVGDGLYLEKPGQDFYEPYRAAAFKEWKKEWPNCALEIWGPSR